MKIINKINEYLEKNIEIVIATVVESTGSSPARSGFRMLVASDGSLYGSVGGGALEYKAVETAKKCLERHKNRFEEYDLLELGMACGGGAKIFYEYLAKSKYLYIFGAGHICRALSPIAETLGYRIVIVDDRPEVTQKEMHPQAEQVICGDFTETIRQLQINTPASALIVTNKHLHDYDCIKELLIRSEEFSYIGMIGSKNKVADTFQRLLSEGVDKSKLEKVYAPVGLKIGGDTPAEIAVGIAAEMIAVSNGRQLPHMKL